MPPLVRDVPDPSPLAVLHINATIRRAYLRPDADDSLESRGLELSIAEPDELARYQAREVTRRFMVMVESGARAE